MEANSFTLQRLKDGKNNPNVQGFAPQKTKVHLFNYFRKVTVVTDIFT